MSIGNKVRWLSFDRKIFFELLNYNSKRKARDNLNPIQDGHFRGCSRMGGGRRGGKKASFPKIRHTYSTIMKLGSYTLPKEDPKNVSIL